jgi:hypothetical protein
MLNIMLETFIYREERKTGEGYMVRERYTYDQCLAESVRQLININNGTLR